MARTKRTHDVQRAGPLAVGAHRFKIATDEYADVGLQWIVETATVGASATITVYASALQHDDPRLDSLDPTTNEYWSAIPTTFAVLPGATAGSDFLPIADNATATLLIEVTVAGADYTDFALLMSGFTRG